MIKHRQCRLVTDHAIEQLRQRAGETGPSRDLRRELDQAVDVNFRKERITPIDFKGKVCWIVDLGATFPVTIYAAVVDANPPGKFKQVVVTVMTRGQFDENMRTGKWSGWFSDQRPLSATLGERMKGLGK